MYYVTISVHDPSLVNYFREIQSMIWQKNHSLNIMVFVHLVAMYTEGISQVQTGLNVT